MIKIPYSSETLKSLADDYYADLINDFSLLENLKNYNNIPQLTTVTNYLADNLPAVIKGEPKELEDLSKVIELKIDFAVQEFLNSAPVLKTKKGNEIKSVEGRRKKAREILLSELGEIINYDKDLYSFVKLDGGKLAYKHSKRLKINTCPYCNLTFTYTIEKNGYKARPTFDHFLLKSKYPYFGLSFYNLIPCCYLCNSSSLKGIKKFSIESHLHPFLDDLDGLFKFVTEINAVDFLVNDEKFDIVLKPIPGISSISKLKGSNNLAAFKIVDRYEFHKDVAGEIIRKAYIYNSSQIKAMLDSFEINGIRLFKSEKEIKEFLLGNFLDPINFSKKIFSKLTKDLAEEFGLGI